MNQPHKVQLSIPEPCHEPETNMITCGTGKFCFSCSKYVYDFTNWSTEQIQDFFKKRNYESVCAKVKPQVLTPTPTQLANASKKILRMFAYALYLVFGMALFSCNGPKDNNTMGMMMPPITVDTISARKDTTAEENLQGEFSLTQIETIPYTAIPGNNPSEIDTPIIPSVEIEYTTSFSGALVSYYTEEGVEDTIENRIDTTTRFENPQEVYEQQSVKLYPNPSDGTFKIDYKLKEQGDVLIKVYDLTGKEVAVIADEKQKPDGFYNTTATLNFLPAGNYILFASLNKEVFTHKFVIVK